MYLKKIIKDFILKLVLYFANLRPAFKILIYNTITPMTKRKTSFGDLIFYTPNSITKWRIDTLLEKEPDTIDWINSFEKNSVFFDIGANIGIYSVYAAKKGIKVFSFEPEALNYSLLNQNIYLNNLQHLVLAYNLALSDCERMDKLYLREMAYGGALHNFGENLDHNKNNFNEIFRQGTFANSIDNLIENYNLPLPNYIKIDVDGNESQVIMGMQKTLKNPFLKGVLVELNTNLKEDSQVNKVLLESGFKCIGKDEFKEGKTDKYGHIINFTYARVPNFQINSF